MAGLVKLGALESVQSQSATDSVRVAHQIIKVDANFEKASENRMLLFLKRVLMKLKTVVKAPLKKPLNIMLIFMSQQPTIFRNNKPVHSVLAKSLRWITTLLLPLTL